MDKEEDVGINQYDWNIDRALIFIIPRVLLTVLFWMPEEELLQSSFLCIAIFQASKTGQSTEPLE